MKLSEIIGTEIIGGNGYNSLFAELQIRGKDGKIYNLTPAKGTGIEVNEQKPFRFGRQSW